MDLLIDCETYSTVDLRACGQHVYAEHEDTETLLWSIRSMEWEDSLVFEGDLYDILRELKAANRIKWTKNQPLTLLHWGSFDRIMAEGVEGVSIQETAEGFVDEHGSTWIDLREVSLTCGAPGHLAGASLFWGGKQTKSEGKHLIRRFCVPTKDGRRRMPEEDPVRWEEFRAYARQDTNVMPDIYRGMLRHVGHSIVEHWPFARCVGRMNERGAPIDSVSAQVALQLLEGLQEEIKVEIETAYGFSPTNPAKVKAFLGTENCQAETLEKLLLDPDLDEEKREIILARQAVGGAATKKLKPMLMMCSGDGRARGMFDYHGAHTRRLTSFGVQWQNMLRSPSSEAFFEHINDPALSADLALGEEVRRNIRGFVCAPTGSRFVAADYSQIELRYGAWIAGEGWMLDAFRENDVAVHAAGKQSPEAWATDLYVLAAQDLMGKQLPHDVSGDERQFGKTVELSSIFGISAVGKHGDGGLKAYAAGMGVKMTDEDAWHAWKVYRDTHQKIVAAWSTLEGAVQQAIAAPPMTRVKWGWHLSTPHIIERGEAYVRIIRPSGFASYLWMPQLVEATYDDGTPRMNDFGEPEYNIRYLGRNKAGVMVEKRTWGADLFQTCVQGGAADLMLEGMLRAEQRGYPPILSVHDEVVTEVPEGHGSVDELCDILCELPLWAKGLPVTAEGWDGRRFTK